MKYILLLLSFFPLVAFGQDSARVYKHITDKDLYMAGKELKLSCSQHTTGTILELGGFVVTGIGAASSSNGKVSNAVYAGAALSLIGWLIEQGAWSHIRLAGMHLQGNSISISIPNKKKK